MIALTALERVILRLVQGDLPEGLRPYAAIAARAGLSEEEVLKGIRGLLKRGVVRRVAAVPNDRKFGYDANAMVVWRVDEDELERAGAAAAARPEISHVYARKTGLGWPYNFYTLIPGKAREEVLTIVKELGGSFRSPEHRVLFTMREFTKRPPHYGGLEDAPKGSAPREEA